MQDKEKETPSWNPPEPPWKPEPETLEIGKTPDPSPPKLDLEGKTQTLNPEPEPVNRGLEEKIEEMVGDEDLSLEGILEDVSKEDGPKGTETNSPPGLAEYVVKCATGIIINGKAFGPGPHFVDEGTYETLSTLDAPYQ